MKKFRYVNAWFCATNSACDVDVFTLTCGPVSLCFCGRTLQYLYHNALLVCHFSCYLYQTVPGKGQIVRSQKIETYLG